MENQTEAFVGAEGYGSHTIGGRGGAVLTVTNLEDAGVGSLRWALEQSGPRIVVFAVNGTIHLKQQIIIDDPNITIAGQTAPGEGITIAGSRIRVKADEVIIRGLHFRPGDEPGGMDPSDRDGLFIGTTDYRLENIIVDHNSFQWGVDENVAINGNVHNVTLSNNIIAQGLSKSIHPKGEHSKGLLISNWGSLESDYNTNITVTKNFFAGNQQRNPEVRAGQSIEIINNYIYDYGLEHTAIFVGGGSQGKLALDVALIGNALEAGPNSDRYKVPIAVSAMSPGSRVIIEDNLWSRLPLDGSGNQDQSKLAWNNGGLQYLSSTYNGGSGVHVLDSHNVKTYVLKNAGARQDSVDQKIIDAALNGDGALVDSVAEAGGRPVEKFIRATTDSDRDGMPNWFEDMFGFNSLQVDSSADSDADGYTNIEEYINGIYTGFDLPSAGNFTPLTLDKHIPEVVALGYEASDIRGFDAAAGDRFDLSRVLPSYNPLTHNLADFLEVATVRGDTILSIDRDGSSETHKMEIIAILRGHTSFLLNGLLLAGTPINMNQSVEYSPKIIVFSGTEAADTITGTARADHIRSLGGADAIRSEDGDDWLEGGDGNDTLDGGIGLDTMEGGSGNDTYLVDAANDVVTEAPGGGHDLVRSKVSFTLSPEVEDLLLTSASAIAGIGNSGGNRITGSQSDNLIMGLTGDDQLSGEGGHDLLDGGDGNDKIDGGSGADTMRGGNGDDLYIVDNGKDMVIEDTDCGIDRISSSVDFEIAGGVENLTLTGTAAITGTGNTLDNKIVGNSAPNILSGQNGNDHLSGGAGQDSLDGGAGNDTLDGGEDFDVMFGGAGNDIYVVDHALDRVVETVGGGEDNVIARVNFRLDVNVENLSMQGEGGLSGYGNGLSNKMTGNIGDNWLEGLGGSDRINGGAGADTIIGGLGSDILTGGNDNDCDVFVFLNQNLDSSVLHPDTITDFKAPTDLIDLENVQGALTGAEFAQAWMPDGGYSQAWQLAQSTKGTGIKVVFIAGRQDGYLFWDADADGRTLDQGLILKGLGSGDQHQFVTLPSFGFWDII